MSLRASASPSVYSGIDKVEAGPQGTGVGLRNRGYTRSQQFPARPSTYDALEKIHLWII